jgi:hypothetical protein
LISMAWQYVKVPTGASRWRTPPDSQVARDSVPTKLPSCVRQQCTRLYCCSQALCACPGRPRSFAQPRFELRFEHDARPWARGSAGSRQPGRTTTRVHSSKPPRDPKSSQDADLGEQLGRHRRAGPLAGPTRRIPAASSTLLEVSTASNSMIYLWCLHTIAARQGAACLPGAASCLGGGYHSCGSRVAGLLMLGATVIALSLFQDPWVALIECAAAAAIAAAAGWLQSIIQRWQQLNPQQQAYTAVLGLVLAYLLPKLLQLLVVLIERLIVGGLLATEELILRAIPLVRAGGTCATIKLCTLASAAEHVKPSYVCCNMG